jgi:hypothetical protein
VNTGKGCKVCGLAAGAVFGIDHVQFRSRIHFG